MPHAHVKIPMTVSATKLTKAEAEKRKGENEWKRKREGNAELQNEVKDQALIERDLDNATTKKGDLSFEKLEARQSPL